MDPARPGAQSLAISGDRILAVGTHDDVAACRGEGTRIVDAGGASVLPGFIESHMHIFPGGAQLDRLSLAGLPDPEAVARAVRERAATEPGDGLILAEQAHYATLGDGVAMTRHLLDRILPDRPLALYAGDHHTMWANTAALKAAGLLEGAETPAGCEVVMGDDGLAGGELREFEAFSPVLAMTANGGRDGNGLANGRALPKEPSAEERARDRVTIEAGLAYCASLGITSFHNMDADPHQLDILGEIDRDGKMPCRAYMPLRMLPGHPLSDFQTAVADRQRYASAHLKCGFVKMFMDGVIEATTAYMLDDYGGKAGMRGAPLFETEEFEAFCIEADRLGLQIAVHAIGDAAVRRTLDGYAAARKANGARDSRHRIEHIETLDPADLPRFKELGVVASMQPTHAPGAYFPFEPSASLIGRKRLGLAFAWQQLREAGARLCFASDWPVAPLDPLMGIKTALTRKPAFDGAPDERQSLDDTLAAFTRDGAWVEFAEQDKGMLRQGMLADVVLLTGDIDKTPAEEADGLAVAMTLCGGKVTYAR
ncbi:amidohydrolase [Rhodobium gokarnense]|uniref:Amidohydrolase YtcJ n=1 Tax=Rhodobium gokarnense TaxID=364296 RepID=A0ABT3HF19_9HYPH|nr:amidohydrolase [Rhodobium gokarnense]MCW2308994.1 putative amidohydrolase YtcJ [Rhodobium gokarnense]